jgi:hypothetical protein
VSDSSAALNAIVGVGEGAIAYSWSCLTRTLPHLERLGAATARARAMVGKRVQFNDETWEAVMAVARQRGRTFQQLADEAFNDLLRKYGQPVGLMAALGESVGQRRKPRTKKK